VLEERQCDPGEGWATNDNIKRAIQHKSGAEELRRLSIEGGMTTLLQDGIQKVLAGLTDLSQVLAVCAR